MGAAALRCAPLLLPTLPLVGLLARWLPEGGRGPATMTISGSAAPVLLAPLFQGLLGGGCLVRLVGATTAAVATRTSRFVQCQRAPPACILDVSSKAPTV
jgi:hypothetical protein